MNLYCQNIHIGTLGLTPQTQGMLLIKTASK
jgi:hypothetical protein